MQATAFDPLSDAQPGKILHETRNGEMARLGEVPFGLYYGTVDATPLYIMLAGMYFGRPGDIKTIAAIWQNIKAALQWIDTFGDADGTALSNTRGRLKRVSSIKAGRTPTIPSFTPMVHWRVGLSRFVRSKAMYLPQRRMRETRASYGRV